MTPSLPPPTPRARAALDLTVQVRIAARSVLKAAEDCAARGGLAHPEVTLLACVRDHGGAQTVPEIARVRRMQRQSIQPVVDRLVERGLVELAENPRHARSKLVRLTSDGRGLLESVDRVAAESLDRVGKRLDPKEVATAVRVLAELSQGIEEEHGDKKP